MKAAFLLPVVAVADVPLTMSWADWKDQFGMTFNGEEDAAREQVFNSNVAHIESENAKDNTFTLGVNMFTHLSLEEFKAQFTGGKGGSTLGSDDAHLGELEVKTDIASDVDWSTDSSVVNPVKDQGQCGSCWAFSAVGTVESAYALAAGKLGSYAEQQLVDCDTTGGSQGCNGGFNQYGISYIGQTGVASESSYPYKATDGTCRASSVSKELPAGTVAGYQSVGKNNAALQSALNSSPVSITVDADNSWQSYRSGVLSQSCGLFGQIDHAVIAVGYDSSADTFKIRNSWGASWGEAGYVRISNSVSNPYCVYNTAPFVAQISADVTV
jgi:C1A family cysteine protease